MQGHQLNRLLPDRALIWRFVDNKEGPKKRIELAHTELHPLLSNHAVRAEATQPILLMQMLRCGIRGCKSPNDMRDFKACECREVHSRIVRGEVGAVPHTCRRMRIGADG